MSMKNQACPNMTQKIERTRTPSSTSNSDGGRCLTTNFLKLLLSDQQARNWQRQPFFRRMGSVSLSSLFYSSFGGEILVVPTRVVSGL